MCVRVASALRLSSVCGRFLEYVRFWNFLHIPASWEATYCQSRFLAAYLPNLYTQADENGVLHFDFMFLESCSIGRQVTRCISVADRDRRYGGMFRTLRLFPLLLQQMVDTPSIRRRGRILVLTQFERSFVTPFRVPRPTRYIDISSSLDARARVNSIAAFVSDGKREAGREEGERDVSE